jgi:hypothetical protein
MGVPQRSRQTTFEEEILSPESVWFMRSTGGGTWREPRKEAPPARKSLGRRIKGVMGEFGS